MPKYPHRKFCVTFVILTLSWCLCFQAEAALIWNLAPVDTTGSIFMPALDLDSSGNPHISYYDETNQNLKYAKWTGTFWSIQNVEPFGSGYDVSDLALDSNGIPHILYSKYTMGQLRYAVWNGSAWTIQIISQPWVDSPAIAFDKLGNFHIIFRTGDLKYAKLVGASWNITTVDTAGGMGNSLAVDNNGNPHISYVSYVSEQQQPLRYAKWTGTAWNLQTVDATGICYYTSIAVDSNGNPHISYSYKANQTSTNLSMKYAEWTGTEWNIQTISSATNTGYFSSIVLRSSNNPQICYDDLDGTGSLKYANWTGATWNTQTVDGPNAQSGSMVLHSTGNPRIGYSSSAGLKYAELIDPSVTPPIPEFQSFAMISTLVITSLLWMMTKGRRKGKSSPDARAVRQENCLNLVSDSSCPSQNIG